MIFGKTRTELKVGVFVFIGLIILVIFVLSIGGIKTWSSRYKVNFIFRFVNGTKLGAPVRFAGVDVGEVKRVSFIYPSGDNETKILLECWINSSIKIPADSTIWVNTLGLLGEKYIEIMPGEDYEHCLERDGIIVGVDPIPMHEVFRQTRDIVATLQNSIKNVDEAITKIKNKEGTVGKLLYDDSIYNNLDAMILDLRKNPWKLFFKAKEKK